MEPEISLIHDGFTRYRLKEDDSYVKCVCGCTTFMKNEENYCCINCMIVLVDLGTNLKGE